jgi:hypothetical protein
MTSEPQFIFQAKLVSRRAQPLVFNPWQAPNNVTAHVGRLAAAFTNVVRNEASANGTERIIGPAWESETFVNIRWPWVSLPLFLLLFSLAFLLTTVLKSTEEQSHGIGIWKTSALAILFNGLGEDVQKSVGTGCGMGEIRARAREIHVKLIPD